MTLRVARNTAANVVGLGLSMGVTLLLTPFLIRTLGEQAYGLWVLALSFSVLLGFLSLLDLGLQSSVVKFVAEHNAAGRERELGEVLRTALAVYLVVGLVAAAGVAVVARAGVERVFRIPSGLEPEARMLLYLMAVQVLVEFLGVALQAVLEGLQRYDLIMLVSVVANLLWAVPAVPVLSAGAGVVGLGALYLVCSAARVGMLLVAVHRVVPGIVVRPAWSRRASRELAAFGSRIFVVRVNATVYNHMDKAIVGFALGAAALTEYDLAYKLQAAASVALTLVSAVIMPAASDLIARRDLPALADLFLRATRYNLAFCLAVTVPTMVLAGDILFFWVGPEYAAAANVARLFLVPALMVGASAVAANILVGAGQAAYLARLTTVATAVNLLLSAALVRPLGIAGVIVGTIVGNALLWYPYVNRALGTTQVSWGTFGRQVLWRGYLPGVVVALALSAALTVDRPGSLLAVALWMAVGVLGYLAVFSVSGMDASERRAVLALVPAAAWRRMRPS